MQPDAVAWNSRFTPADGVSVDLLYNVNLLLQGAAGDWWCGCQGAADSSRTGGM